MIRTRVGGIRTGDSDFIEKKCKQAIDNFMADAFEIVKAKTPFDTGRARRGWRKKNKGRKLENRVPYIVRLNEGWSKDSPDGIAEPAIEKLNTNFKKGEYTK